MSRRGFTLLEIVVAAGIFGTAMLIATGLFTTTTRVQKRVQSLSRTQSDARYVLELMASAAQMNGIDYRYYLDPAAFIDLTGGATDRLAISNADGTRTVYRWLPFMGTKTSLGICQTTATETCTTESSYQNITPVNNTVTAFNVYIRPGSDPFAPLPQAVSDCVTNYDPARDACTCTDAVHDCYPSQTCELVEPTVSICKNSNEQPSLTIVLATRSGGNVKPEEQMTSVFQTTVTVRSYKR